MYSGLRRDLSTFYSLSIPARRFRETDSEMDRETAGEHAGSAADRDRPSYDALLPWCKLGFCPTNERKYRTMLSVRRGNLH